MAVPIAVIAERKVVAHFLDAGAISMADAIPYTPGRTRRTAARSCGSRGAISSGPTGRVGGGSTKRRGRSAAPTA